MGISKRQLERLFQQEMKQTVQQYSVNFASVMDTGFF
ncbi:hypothetical protein ACOJBM_35500 [Rhizobium beringeri]